MDKQTVAVIFGGCSSEHEVSLESAAAVIENIDRDKFEPVLLGITKDGEWFRYYGDVSKLRDGTWRNPRDCVHAFVIPDRTVQGILEYGKNGPAVTHLDAAFPVLHGKNGEDGTVQGLLALADIPVVGCGILASALCMDKDRAHKLAALAGVPVPRSFLLKKPDVASARKDAAVLGYPLFMKPVKAGSSFGITRVTSEDELPEAIRQAFLYDEEAVMEEAITGFEVGCAVMGTDKLVTGEVDEIELTQGFFDFKEKYNLITSSIHVPARIPAAKAEEIKRTAKVVYAALGCAGFARVDMFLTPCGEVVFNEVNTIPGFTAHSRFPGMMRAVGIELREIVTRAIEEAIHNYEDSQRPKAD